MNNPDTEPTKEQRAERAYRLLLIYEQSTGASTRDRETTIANLITDLLHMARDYGDPGEIMGNAALDFSAQEEDAPTPADDPTGTGASIERAFNMPGEVGEFATGSGEPSLRVFYVCPCGNEWTEENGPEHGACDSECECGVTVSADHSEEI